MCLLYISSLCYSLCVFVCVWPADKLWAVRVNQVQLCVTELTQCGALIPSAGPRLSVSLLSCSVSNDVVWWSNKQIKVAVQQQWPHCYDGTSPNLAVGYVMCTIRSTIYIINPCSKLNYTQMYCAIKQYIYTIIHWAIAFRCELSILVWILGMDCRSVTLFFPLSRHWGLWIWLAEVSVSLL